MLRTVRTLRNHWKKSIFFSGVAVFGLNYAKNKFDETLMMKNFCKEALAYGEPAVPVSHIPYHVTVVLNPAACGGKGRARFEKYCAPLLHLAGIKVSVMRTEGEGQAKDVLEVVKDCDAVLIAGGDGTLMEAVTGFMRRQSVEKFKLPMGVLPIGKENRMAKNLFPASANFTEARLMAEATMSVVRQLYLRPMDVIEVENVGDEQLSGKKIYGLRQIQTGAFRDAESRMSRYWFFAGLKKYVAYVFAYTTSAKDIFWKVPGKFESLVEPETSESDESQTSVSAVPKSKSWPEWISSKVFGSTASQEVSANEVQRVVESTWQTVSDDFQGAEFCLQSSNDFSLSASASKPVLRLTLAPENLSFFDFVAEGWRRQREKSSLFPSSWHSSESKSFLWTPSQEFLGESDNRQFNLDGEAIDFKGSMKVSVLSGPIMMFCAPETFYSFSRPSDDDQQPAKKWWQRSGTFRTTQLAVPKKSF